MRYNYPVTDSNIQSLLPNQIFVFGSNESGIHGAGAAKLALDKFGAVYGQGVGLQGNSYALPTKDFKIETLSILDIRVYVDQLFEFAYTNPTLQFLITEVGCGLAGYKADDIAPLFNKFIVLTNCTLPQSFLNILTPNGIIKGFKAFNKDDDGIYCRDFRFDIGGFYKEDRAIICQKGFHFCEKIIDTLNYYNRADNVVYCEVIGWGEFDSQEDKVCTNNIYIQSLYNHSIDDFNSGNRNSGDWNSGNRNSGDWNSGDGNSGNRNSGNWNSGDGNSGDWNSGNRNSGNRNSGDWNSGDWNSGDWNSGDGKNRYLCSKGTPLYVFNLLTAKKVYEIYFPSWLYFNIITWKSSSEMTAEEKEAYPLHEVCGGWLFTLDYKEAAQENYNKATKSEQDAIENVPNYDAQVLYDLFGIDRRNK